MNIRLMRSFAAAAALMLLISGCRPMPERLPSPPPEVKETAPEIEPAKSKPAPEPVNYQRAAVFVQAMETLHHRYVDSEKVDYDRLFEAAMRGMASSLDPYSDYEPPANYEVNEIQRTGEMTGIGVEVVKPAGQPLTIISVIPNSPAEKAGLVPGDQIVEINDQPIKTLNFSRAVELLKGTEGSSVKLQLIRAGSDTGETVEVQRGVIVRASIPPDAIKVIDGDIGYMRIESFTPHTVEEFDAALARLKEKPLRGLIIDLRYNPGGVVGAAAGVAARLLPPGKLLFTAAQRDGGQQERITSDGNFARETRLPVILLVNSFSASSSELFSAALRDNDRARLVGMRTFGKATLLRIVPLPNGGALRYASGRYLTPAGNEIERRGLLPDEIVNLPSQQVFKLSSQIKKFPGEVKPDKPGAIEDIQLKKAIELLTQPEEKQPPETAAAEEKPVPETKPDAPDPAAEEKTAPETKPDAPDPAAEEKTAPETKPDAPASAAEEKDIP